MFECMDDKKEKMILVEQIKSGKTKAIRYFLNNYVNLKLMNY